PRLADKHTGAAVEEFFQFTQAAVVLTAYSQGAVAQLFVAVQHFNKVVAVAVVNQVGFIQQDNGFNTAVFRRHQVAVNQVGMGFRFRRDHQHNKINVGGHRFNFVIGVGAG